MNFRELLKEKKLIFFDGAMGTSLQPYLPPGSPPEILNLTSPQRVKEVHLSYLKEGVDVIETNTFGANRIKLDKSGLLSNKLKEINYNGVKIAKEVASSQFVGVSVGPLGSLIQPWGDITVNQALEVFKEQIEIVAEAGADLIVIETMASLKEAKIAAVAARKVCTLPVVCQLTFEEKGKTLFGTDARTAVFALQALDVDVVGANCSVGPKEMFFIAKNMIPFTIKPLIFQPNAGRAYLKDRKTLFPVGPDEFSQWMREIAQEGARIIGGCCGTTSAHIAAMIHRAKDVFIPPKKYSILRGFSSRTRVYSFEGKDSLLLGVNLSSSFIQRESLDKISDLLSFVAEKGCSFLNLSLRGENKKFNVGRFVNFIQQSVDIGISIDTDEGSLLEEGLAEIEGRSLVFLSLQDKEDVLKIAREWGATLGFNIYLESKVDIKKEFEKVIEKCSQIDMRNFREIAVKIDFPPLKKCNFSLKEKILEIEKIKSHIPTNVILNLDKLSEEVADLDFLEEFLLELINLHSVEGVILNFTGIDSYFSALNSLKEFE